MSGPTICTGGIASGTYRNMLITGSCAAADDARITIRGNLTLAKGAVFNAVSLADVHIRGNVLVGPGAVFGLGCTVLGVGCTADTHDTIGGNVLLDRALTTYLDGDTVNGNVVSIGGGPGVGFDPYINFVMKDNVFNANVLVTGWRGTWLGLIRNQTRGSVVVAGNQAANPDSTEIVHNTIGGNLVCLGNTPAAQFGDAGEGLPPNYPPNVVGGRALGECASLVAA